CLATLPERWARGGGSGLVAAHEGYPRYKEGYIGITINTKPTIAGVDEGGASAQKRSPSGKFGGVVGGEGTQWRRMLLPAMLLGETVLEIPPRTPKPAPRTRKPAAGEPTPLHAWRGRVKQSHRGGTVTRGADAPRRRRAAACVTVGRPFVSANRVSPKNRPWVKKVVMFPNSMFHASTSAATDSCATSSPSKKQKWLYKTRSPVVAQQTPHKFLVKVTT
ncbi:hypothetical protein ACJX0J_009335, partial [Zea mays]